MANYYVLLTDHGKSFIANAQATSQLALTHVVLGDANDQPYLPESRLAQTSLVHQRAKLLVASVKVVNDTTAEVSAVVPSNVGGWNVHEVGITDSSGKLVYVGNFHGGYRPTLTEGAGGDMELIFTITADNLATVVIEMDNHTVSATRGWVTEHFVTQPEFQAHLDATDPHSQYLNKDRFQLLLQTLIPFGYQYDTHTPSNPKPMFDELLGIATHWRRITGKIMVATDPSDAAIKDHSVVLGQRGMTELANSQRPHIYPLQTSHKFERYDPSTVVETVWKVVANKTSINEGDAVRFTVTANNLPDGQILNWSVKEGVLNSSSNDIVSSEKTDSGTVILKNGQAVIDFTTTPDDNEQEPQKHVRLTVGAPAHLSINVPISDAGHTETVVHISRSTTDGINLAEYYKTQYGTYPSADETVRFIVDSAVDIIAPNTATPALTEGTNWPTGNTPIVENHGRILGRGGDGGRSAYIKKAFVAPFGVDGYNSAAESIKHIESAKVGGNGGVAIKGGVKVDNYGLIAGGGGGGGGMGMFVESSTSADPHGPIAGGGGSGGGAPLGHSSPNERTIKAHLVDSTVINKVTAKPPYRAAGYFDVQQNSDKALVNTIYPLTYNMSDDYEYPLAYKAFNQENTRWFSIPLDANLQPIEPYNLDYREYYLYVMGDPNRKTMPFYMSTNASIDKKGLGGAQYSLGINPWQLDPSTQNPSINVYDNHGGDGGSLGENGQSGQMNTFFKPTLTNGRVTGIAESTKVDAFVVAESCDGGLAGYIKEGSVTIINYSNGVTKGRSF